MKKISFVFGTRPEAIKLCPLILAMKADSNFEPTVCVTGQHREMLDQVLQIFGIIPDVDLQLMQPNQTLASFTSRAIESIDSYLRHCSPDLVIVQGDTTTVLSASIAAFYNKIPVGHVEAGLRTWHKYSPFPEEMNRIIATRIADYHFAPTKRSLENLIKEGINRDSIYITGNTVIDALFLTVEKIRKHPQTIAGLPYFVTSDASTSPLVLITGHRRENFGKGFENICKAIAFLADKFSDANFVYPVHLNPNVKEPVHKLLSGKKNIFLIEPLSYLPFVALMERSKIILTDSGGIQEEAPSLGKPVLVMRDNTERPEAVEAGTVKLVGTDTTRIIESVSDLLLNEKLYDSMSFANNPYGDGTASSRILNILKNIT